ncbi:hypothetical protein HELRODRAFT_188909 [Helobdella robusta]|uniref:Polyprenal reductase n=1 Tax=Helobdella robusta TaxID=6412 RepID=T1FQG8_HELRO|nr:hypothetical protein HELRODRAFT_188909 [Helobdella robusta]ESN98781.1 hypothetical protein HELRODRAFT_188909 [Helobdella robusta]
MCHLICRYHQCVFISVHSWKQVVGPVWIAVIYVNQVAYAVSLVAEGSKMDETSECFSLSKLNVRHLVAIILFALATNVQYKTFAYLASLRRNKAGHVVTTNYKPPNAGMFQQLNLSSPHYFAEIVIYFAVLVAMGTNCLTWMTVTYCVACHMTYLAYVTHQYYLDTFSNVYPKHRNIIIPFLF